MLRFTSLKGLLGVLFSLLIASSVSAQSISYADIEAELLASDIEQMMLAGCEVCVHHVTRNEHYYSVSISMKRHCSLMSIPIKFIRFQSGFDLTLSSIENCLENSTPQLSMLGTM